MARGKTPKDASVKTQKQTAPKPTIISRAEPIAIRELAPDLQDRIRTRAYQLWEQRGRQHGNPEEDWLQAEREVLGREIRTA